MRRLATQSIASGVLRLRPYQKRAVDELRKALVTQVVGNPLAVLPPGTGKSLLVAELVCWSRYSC